MLVSRTSVRQFPLAWPPWQPPSHDGVAAIVSPGSPIAWADSLLARADGQLVVWTGTGVDAERQGLALLRQPGVQAAVLSTARSDPRRVGLALEVGLHLAGTREDTPAAGPCLTSWSPPEPPVDSVRIPHLVTAAYPGGVTDVVVWELAPIDVAQRWLGGPLPDLAFFESRLETLLRLRTAARRGQLPSTAVTAGLADLLPDRDLSIRHVYEHPELFRNLLGA